MFRRRSKDLGSKFRPRGTNSLLRRAPLFDEAMAGSGASDSAGPEHGTRYTQALRRSSGHAVPQISRTGIVRSPRARQLMRRLNSWLRCRASGPNNWPEQRWYELALDFAQGQYGLLVDSYHYVAYFENPADSALVGRVGYALPPAGPNGVRRPNLWTWSVVMNTRARDRSAAWRFIEWATSREFLLRSAFEGNMNPTRRSTWDNERFRDHTSGWGSFYDVARTLIEQEATVLVTPAPRYLAIAARWAGALLEAFGGPTEVEEALARAATDIDELVLAGDHT